MTDRTAQWQLPEGVTRGVWDYSLSESMASDYDEYFSEHPLFAADQSMIREFFPQLPNPLVADFGCGTGRLLVPLVQQTDARGLAIDLSDHMLNQVQSKADEYDLNIYTLRANLVALDCIQSELADFGLCMFSTLGMIRGSENRQQALAHFFRILKPGATLILHVHNHWFHFFDPGGIRWTLYDLLRVAMRKDLQLGDKYCDYRGIPRVYLHSFRKRELSACIRAAGFEIAKWLPLNATQAKPLPWQTLLEGIRASGWIVAARKPTS